jgi:nicotinamidase-related amidase
MALDLAALLKPERCALLMMECQEGVIGGEGRFSALADAVARHGTVSQIARLLRAARAAGVPVFHLTTSRRADGRGAIANCVILAAGKKAEPMVPGSRRHAVVAELAPMASDFLVDRQHGLTPFHGTELDQLLRNLGVQTVVATGVSVNVGLTGLTIEAVNCGYQVVIPRQAVAGTPDEYVEAVLANSLRLLATITSVEEVRSAWGSG